MGKLGDWVTGPAGLVSAVVNGNCTLGPVGFSLLVSDALEKHT